MRFDLRTRRLWSIAGSRGWVTAEGVLIAESGLLNQLPFRAGQAFKLVRSLSPKPMSPLARGTDLPTFWWGKAVMAMKCSARRGCSAREQSVTKVRLHGGW